MLFWDEVRKARALLESHWDGNLPVSIQKICQHAAIPYGNTSYYVKECPALLKGISLRVSWKSSSCGSYFLIESNYDEIEVRQHFSKAVGLAVICLGLIKPASDDVLTFTHFSIEDSSFERKGCLYFALALLMPEFMITRLIKHVKNIQELADAFQLATPAVRAWIKTLKLL